LGGRLFEKLTTALSYLIYLCSQLITLKYFMIMGKLGPMEIVLILAIVLLLFGGKKIPELMKGLGKGVKNFKDGMKNDEEESKPGSTSGN